MPWYEVSAVMQREEFAALAAAPGANVSLLCRRCGISRKTGYKWLGRRDPEDPQWARDRSRAPLCSPGKLGSAAEEAVLAVRRDHPCWGGRKIRRRLQDLGAAEVPSASTVTAILRRHGLIAPEASAARGPLQRFEREAPNELWQMDFKGAVATAAGPCHPLTVVDDHSRYAVCIEACPDERAATVKGALEKVFRRYGLPQRMLMDNGPCWGRVEARYTVLNVWQLRLGIRISHGRPYHPQTQGKNERFNRTLKAEAIARWNFADLPDCQRAFDSFRRTYNQERPHEALALATPASRYRPSIFEYPERLPEIQYEPGDVKRKVTISGCFSWKNVFLPMGRAFAGEWIALRPTPRDAIWDVYYCAHVVGRLDLRSGKLVDHEEKSSHE